MKKRILILLILIVLGLWGTMRYCKMNSNDLALLFLSKVKSIKGDAVDLSLVPYGKAEPIDHSEWTKLLKCHVTSDGRVNYKGFIEDQKALEAYLTKLSRNPPNPKWNQAHQLAYWINAYNAFTIKLIIDHYPISSIKDIGEGLPMINSPWDIKFFTIGGVAFDLNTIEHDILRIKYDEPRIHFAINCASISCPALRSEAYTGERLITQLAEQTHDFINDPSKNNITAQRTHISQIFNWFNRDFVKKSDLGTFLQAHHPAYNSNNKVEYMPYDWGLNE